MSKIQKILFIAVVIGQISVLGFMITKRLLLLKNGKKILIECQPRDPRSLFSGDYVILNYKISRLNREIFVDSNLESYKRNDTVFVALELDKNRKYYIAKKVSKDISKLRTENSIIVSGKLQSSFSKWNKVYFVKYGVEEYFVPQKEGLRIEKSMSKVSILLSVIESGESAISKLFIDDKEVLFN